MSEYNKDAHKHLPHVVKVSGGRSSAMMLLRLLRQRKLKASRKDVVVFNNTSAEHPATYEFVSKLKEECEAKHGIPFFWLEFQTYEDGSSQGKWKRYSTYRLVLPERHGKANPDGYRWAGEVFEEMISYHNLLPDRRRRSCTQELKVATTKAFLAEWLAGRKISNRQGHYMEQPLLTEEELAWQYKYRNGEDEETYLNRKRYLLNRPFMREAQDFNDFSLVGNRKFKKAVEGLEDGYVSVIGIRGDEPHRVASIRARMAKEDTPEIIWMPLVEAGTAKKDVVSFWNRQKYDLRIPYETNLTNCVYCFMKSHATLVEIGREMTKIDKGLPPELRSVKDTPTDIDWWIKIEEKYRRIKDGNTAKTKNSKIRIGFFGVSKEGDKNALSYKNIWIMAQQSSKTKKPSNQENVFQAQCDVCGDY